MQKTTNQVWPLFFALCGLLLTVWSGHSQAALPPATGGQLTVILAQPLATLDPALVETPGERQVAALITEPLFATNGKQVNGRLVLRYQMEDQGRCLHLWLKPDVLFHDGQRLTAEDVKASLQRLLSPTLGHMSAQQLHAIAGSDSFRKGDTTQLDGIEIVSPVELRIRLTRAQTDFPLWLSDPATAILPERQAKQENLIAQPIGTGPFRLNNFSANSAALIAFDDCHSGRPFMDRLAFVVASDEKREGNLLRSASAQASFGGRVKSRPDYQLTLGAMGSEVLLSASDKSAISQDFWWSLVDCKALVTLFESRRTAPFAGKSAPSKQPVIAQNPALQALSQKIRQTVGQSCSGFSPDLKRAKKLYEESGKKPLVLLVREDQTELKRMAQRVALQAAEAGIEIHVNALPAMQLAQARAGKDWSATLSIRPAFHFPDDRSAKADVVLYHLLPQMLWQSRKWSSTAFDVWGVLDLASLYRRQP